MIKDAIINGYHNLLFSYLKIAKSQNMVVIYSPECRVHAASLTLYAKAFDINAYIIPMSRIEDDGLCSRLEKYLPDNDSFRHNYVLTMERDTMSHQRLISDILENKYNDNYTKCGMISVCDDFFEYTIQAQPEKTSA